MLSRRNHIDTYRSVIVDGVAREGKGDGNVTLELGERFMYQRNDDGPRKPS